MNIKIIVLYPNSFPLGGAATNRVIQICKTILFEGNTLKLYITRPTEKRGNIQTTRSGVYEGIEYKYVNKSIIWPGNKFNKFFCQLIGLINTSVILTKEKYDIVISYADYSLIHHLLYFVLIKFRNKRFIYSIDEFPWQLIYKRNSVFDHLHISVFYKLFDALLVMTNTLMKYYANKIRKNSKMFHFPMSVEIERFRIPDNEHYKDQSYVAYCGYDTYYKNGSIISKDGVDLLIESFAIVSQRHKDILLYIIGESNILHTTQVEELNLKGKVIFLGKISHSEVPRYLNNAKLLLLARPDSIQAQGAFPSKLGEYLSTGNPVVVTSVGEIPFYLKDNFNAFLAKPGDIHSFAERMDYALTNPDIAKEVGLRGREVAEIEFDYKRQGTKLNEFLLDI
jgi:glycosyltransferase involved in cell wall biosynthesis